MTESFPYPYPILKRSPMGMAGFQAAYSGSVEAMMIVTAGAVELRSRRLLDDPLGKLGSPANKVADRDTAQTEGVGSVYLDAGKTFEAGAGWKGAMFAAIDAFGFRPMGGGKHSGDALVEANVGTAWLKSWGTDELSLHGDIAFEAANRRLYRNELDVELAPSGRLGAEYSGVIGGSSRWRAGLEGRVSRADSALRPYLGFDNERLSAIIAADFAKANDPFYPDSQALAAGLKVNASPSLQAGVSGRYERSLYALAPAPEHDGRFMAELTWTPGAKSLVRTARTWAAKRQEAADEAARQELLQRQSDSLASKENIRGLIAASPTLKDFLAAYKPKSSLGVLAAVSEMTALFSQYNYNDNEGAPPNLQSVDEIYGRMRGSYLSRQKDPTLVCLGAAQSAAFIAEELGRINGVPIEASGISIEVSDENGRQAGHAVAAVKTGDYGIVFVDWGRVTPTYSWNTEEALRLYQALGGQPAIFHQITDPSRNGRHVGYLFTEEGRLLVESLTFHGEMPRSQPARLFEDDPRGDQATIERYKRMLRRKQ